MKKIFLALVLFSIFSGLSLSAQTYVIDEASILDSYEQINLEEKAKQLSQVYDSAVYLVTVENFKAGGYEGTIEDYAYDYYMAHDFGKDTSKNGLMLILSMAERDFDIMAYGEFGNLAFTDFGKQALEDSFLSDFGDNEWFKGFSSYLKKTEYLLKWAEKGKPYDIHSFARKIERLPFNFILALIISLIIASRKTSLKKKGLNTISGATEAGNYLVSQSVNFTKRNDVYTHTTKSSTKIVSSSSSSSSHGYSGGTTVRSNGSSHHSGKF